MSTTRHASENSPLRQERFASSAEFERGLMANLVAKRCEVIADDQQRQLVWFLQGCSHQDGGLAKLAGELISTRPDRIATRSMQKFGTRPGQIYDAEKVRAVRLEIPSLRPRFHQTSRFPLKGERGYVPLTDPADWHNETKAYQAKCDEAKREADTLPESYPAQAFISLCLEAARNELKKLLSEICLNPALDLADCGPWYFPTLMETLRDYQAGWIARQSAGRVVTALGAMVFETLNYALESRCMVLIDGLARTGKTHAVKQWVAGHPGQARYVQVPSTNDDMGFYRAIARSLGVSINANSKAQELRTRIEDTLQSGGLMIVLDEGHFLWPQGNFREKMPGRISWLMTALVNHQVPVAIVTTPQFMRTQKTMEKNSSWTSEQFTGRIGHYQKLPDTLSETDLVAVAQAFLPEGCAKSIQVLALYAKNSVKYLAAIETAACRAKFEAKKAGRENVIFADVKIAITGSVIPSDTSLAVALSESKKAGRGRAIAAPLTPAAPALPSVREAAAVTPQPSRSAITLPAERDTDLAAIIPLAEHRTGVELKSA